MKPSELCRTPLIRKIMRMHVRMSELKFSNFDTDVHKVRRRHLLALLQRSSLTWFKDLSHEWMFYWVFRWRNILWILWTLMYENVKIKIPAVRAADVTVPLSLYEKTFSWKSKMHICTSVASLSDIDLFSFCSWLWRWWNPDPSQGHCLKFSISF